jgi:integrase
MFPSQEHLPRSGGTRAVTPPEPHELIRWIRAETGGPTNPRTDYSHWKSLLAAAGVRDGRLHDARHTAATVLLLLGVPERAVMSLMGWSNSAMATRYQHITASIRLDIAKRVGNLLWLDNSGAS